jgi:hypothetical protein
VPLGWALVARNATTAAVALAAALPPSARSLAWIDAFTVAGAAAALLLVYRAVDGLIAHRAALLLLVREPEDDSGAEPAFGGRRWSRL